jgi:integrase
MPRNPTPFTEADIAKAQPGTLVQVSGTPNLYVLTSPVRGRHRWYFRIMHDGKLHTRSLGTYPDVPLEWAVNGANYYRRGLKVDKRDPEELFAVNYDGVDDLTKRTLGHVIEKYIENNKDAWTPKQLADVNNLLLVHTKALLERPILRLQSTHIADALRPLWDSNWKTADRVAKRLAIVFDFAIANRWYQTANPVRGLRHLLPKLPKSKTVEVNFASLEYELVPELVQVVRPYQDRSVAAVALEFLILTAARTDEVLGMPWSEVQGNIWTRPPERMKAGRLHRVPLTDRALQILKRQEGNGSDYVFAGRDRDKKRDKPMNERVLREFLHQIQERDPRFADATVHGMRASFKDWAEDHDYNNRRIEECLAHVIPVKVERSYRRRDAFQIRTEIMNAWAEYCGSATKTATPLRLVRIGE